jgi:hypothetical protein
MNSVSKNVKIGILLGVCVSMLCIMCGCSANPKNFSMSGMTITLTDAFSEGKAEAFDVYLKSDDVIFAATEETSDELQRAGYEINSLADYADEILSLKGASKNDLQVRNDYRYFVTTDTVSGASYTYVRCIFKASDAYWVCEFACKTKNYDKLDDKILGWADTIKFD